MTHKQYWTNRISKTTRNLFDKTNEQMQYEIIKLYEDLQEWMEKEVNYMWLKLLSDDISRTDIWTYKHYRELSKSMSIKIAEIGTKEESILNTQLEIALKEIYSTSPIPNEVFTLINETAVKQLLATPWSEKHYSQAVWDNKQKMIKILKDGLEKSIVLGKSKDETVVKLRDLILKEKPDRGFSGAFSDADRLVRTELQHILTQGQCQKYIDHGYTEGEIVTAEDERTCENCSNKDGMKFKLSNNPLPFHARCRCNLIPVLDWGD